jgi:hypothetical protein
MARFDADPFNRLKNDTFQGQEAAPIKSNGRGAPVTPQGLCNFKALALVKSDVAKLMAKVIEPRKMLAPPALANTDFDVVPGDWCMGMDNKVGGRGGQFNKLPNFTNQTILTSPCGWSTDDIRNWYCAGMIAWGERQSQSDDGMVTFTKRGTGSGINTGRVQIPINTKVYLFPHAFVTQFRGTLHPGIVEEYSLPTGGSSQLVRYLFQTVPMTQSSIMQWFELIKQHTMQKSMFSAAALQDVAADGGHLPLHLETEGGKEGLKSIFWGRVNDIRQDIGMVEYFPAWYFIEIWYAYYFVQNVRLLEKDRSGNRTSPIEIKTIAEKLKLEYLAMCLFQEVLKGYFAMADLARAEFGDSVTYDPYVDVQLKPMQGLTSPETTTPIVYNLPDPVPWLTYISWDATQRIEYKMKWDGQMNCYMSTVTGMIYHDAQAFLDRFYLGMSMCASPPGHKLDILLGVS